ncbi:polysaccharide biosynthesis protein [Mucilaginibacter sp. Bleaf8]|uniref:polysaccharide biosynthesis protein n=1 Tax=Mucilaginibacter sp. Bleaf8 TaxID=2834430 RepID=UPI001BCAD581|nr:polysaccharide biosynthesis protein [Mucilaginibacter sp. Bleaf8]MBS7566451.1 polysaccharide biosynthesis protein [Mucilaginibacter sp. Bleaf8]
MKSMVYRAYNNPKYAKILQWSKLLTVTGSAQLVVQGIGLISGVIIIRLLSTQQYALYTIVNTMLGTMTVLTDGGISSGVMAQGGKVWNDRQKLGAVMVTGYNLRKKFAIGSLLLSIPLMYYMLLHQGSDWLQATIIFISLIPSFIAALSDSLLETCIKLKQDITSLQKNQIAVAALRLIASAFLFVTPWAAAAIILSGIPRIWGNVKLRVLSEKYVDWNQPVDKESQSEIMSVVKRVLPGAVYYSFSGQITTWLISIFGNNSSVAQIGALGRITILLSILTSVFGTIIIPRFARLGNDKRVLLKKYLQILISLSIIGVLVIAIVWLFSSQILWVLGSKYATLNNELVLSIVGSTFSLISGASFMLTSGRGWVLNPVITISINILAIIAGIFLFDISTLHGILIFNIFISAVQAVRAIIYGFIAISNSSEIDKPVYK